MAPTRFREAEPVPPVSDQVNEAHFGLSNKPFGLTQARRKGKHTISQLAAAIALAIAGIGVAPAFGQLQEAVDVSRPVLATDPGDETDPDADKVASKDANDATRSDPVIEIRRNSAGERSTLERARLALGRGRADQAISLLHQALDANPGATDERRLLARVQAEAGQVDRAEITLRQGLALADPPASLAMALGRLLIETDQAMAAAETLTNHAPAVADNPDYHLLWAAALRQAGLHSQALERYRLLADTHPRQARAHLGLALSLEALNRPVEALDAYRAAAALNDPRSASFALQRLRALNAPTTD